MATGGAGGEGDVARWETELFGDECAKGFIGFAINGWRLQTYFQRITLVATDFGF